jgi:hypothetical protein
MVNAEAFFGLQGHSRRHPRRRVTQYSVASKISDGSDYWIPAFAGMTILLVALILLRENPVAVGLQSDDIPVLSFRSGATKPRFIVRGVAASLCYEVMTVWMPHSVLALPRQRPERTSSSGDVRLVQGMHPTDR